MDRLGLRENQLKFRKMQQMTFESFIFFLREGSKAKGVGAKHPVH